MEEKKNLGSIKIANEVVAIIASLAATEIEGVAAMSGGVTGGIVEMLGYKKGIKVEAGVEECNIDLSVIIDYGSTIPEVAEQIQINVKQAIESMTGLKVVEVNVHVHDVQFADDEKRPEEEEE